jgi:hypothetical protein
VKEFNLDQEEQEWLEAFDAGEFQSIMTSERKQFIESAAKLSCQQIKRIKNYR